MQKQTINTNDLYQFTATWGKDTVQDTDGSGSIQIDGQTLGAAKGAGQLNTWVAELGADSGVLVGMTVYDDARSANGMQKLVTDISGLSDAAQILARHRLRGPGVLHPLRRRAAVHHRPGRQPARGAGPGLQLCAPVA